jgi:hypothetical protein
MGSALSAQQAPGQWVGDLYRIKAYKNVSFTSTHSEDHFLDENNKIRKKIPSLSEVVDFPVPAEFRTSVFSYWHDGALYALADGDKEKDEDGAIFKRYSLAKWHDDKWHFLGDYKLAPNRHDMSDLLNVIPCDNGRFIIISSRWDLYHNNRPDRTPFHRMSIPEGKTELRIDASIDHGLNDELREHMATTSLFGQAWLSQVVMTDSHALLINMNTGLYWVFSLEKASLVKAGNIFKKMTTDMILRDGFPDPILCVNPEKDGTFLISAQEEDFFMSEDGDLIKEMNQFARRNPLDTKDTKSVDDYWDVFYKRFDRRKEELANRNPFIVWYRIYPEEGGRLEKLANPPIGGAVDRDGGKNDIWRPMLDGSVKMGWIEPEDYKEPKKEEIKEEEAQEQLQPPQKNEEGIEEVEGLEKVVE